MSLLSFNGGSDDLVGVSYKPSNQGDTLTVVDRHGSKRVRLDEEFNVRDGYTEFLVTVDGVDVFVVFGRYGRGGSWGFGVSQVDEDTLLDSMVTVGQSEVSDYSVTLTALFDGGNVVVTELED